MFARKTLILFLTNFFITGLNAIVLIFSVKAYTNQEFGYLSAAASLFNMFLIFSDLGFRENSVKKMAEDVQQEQQYFSSYLITKLIIFPFLSIAFIIIIFIQFKQAILDDNFTQKIVLVILFFWAIFSSMNYIFSASLQSKKLITKMQIPIISGQFVRFILCIIAYLMQNFYLYVGSLLVAQITTFILNLFLNRQLKFSLPDKVIFKQYFISSIKYSIPFMLNTIVFNVGPLLYLKQFNPDLLGVYYILINTIFIFKLFEIAAKSLLIPTISPSLKYDFNKLKSIINEYEKFMLIISTLIIISVVFLSKYALVILYDQSYADLGNLFIQISILYTLSWGLSIPFQILHFIDENYTILIITELIKLGFSLFSWMFLIPKLGFIGIELGVWIALIPNTLILRYFFNKKYNYYGLPKENVLALTISIGLIIISFFLSAIGTNFVSTFLSYILILCIFMLFLFIFKILTKQDVNFLISTMNFKNILTEIKNEFQYEEL